MVAGSLALLGRGDVNLLAERMVMLLPRSSEYRPTGSSAGRIGKALQ